MNITKQEQLMYKIMEAIYNSGIPISFKGSMVLKACLIENNYYDNTRHTIDIDANWNSDTYPSTLQIESSLQKVIDNNNLKLKVNTYREYDFNKSAGFEIIDIVSDELLFTIDIDVNKPLPLTKIYEIDGILFKGVTPTQIIADKVFVVSSEIVFRRIKDIIDLYYLSKVFNNNYDDVIKVIKNNNKTLKNFNEFLFQKDELKHSYDKFRFADDVNKPEFEDLYNTVKNYISDFIK